MNAQVAEAATAIPRFVKIGADGAQLAADAAEWVAVRDMKSGLLWSRTLPCGEITQPEALKAATALDLLGATDWRLPTRAELLTLVDDTRYRPAIDTDFFPNTPSSWFWSSTVDASSPSVCAWLVLFGDGSSDWSAQDFEGFVRAVRPGQ